MDRQDWFICYKKGGNPYYVYNMDKRIKMNFSSLPECFDYIKKRIGLDKNNPKVFYMNEIGHEIPINLRAC